MLRLTYTLLGVLLGILIFGSTTTDKDMTDSMYAIAHNSFLTGCLKGNMEDVECKEQAANYEHSLRNAVDAMGCTCTAGNPNHCDN